MVQKNVTQTSTVVGVSSSRSGVRPESASVATARSGKTLTAGKLIRPSSAFRRLSAPGGRRVTRKSTDSGSRRHATSRSTSDIGAVSAPPIVAPTG